MLIVGCEHHHVNQLNLANYHVVLFKAFACLAVIFWSPWISLAEHSRSSFALEVFPMCR
jgi:hypothetical protein